MSERAPRGDAQTSVHSADTQPDGSTDPVDILARTSAGPSIAGLHRQLGEELAALAMTIGLQRKPREAIEDRLASLSRTIARLGARALRLERDVVQMRHCAYHDPLTGLPNRALLHDRLDRALAQALRREGHVALLIVDVDDFKRVNDAYGHLAGDRLLQDLASRLRRCTRDADTICRYGGDEFVILLPEVDGSRGATAVVQKLHASLATPFRVDGHSITVSASIGTAVYPGDGLTACHLLQHADVAMYGAKDDPARRAPPPGGALPFSGSTRQRGLRLPEAAAVRGAPGTDWLSGSTMSTFGKPGVDAAQRARRAGRRPKA